MNIQIQVIVLTFIFVQVNGDEVDNEIRAEEERRHNATLTKYVKAALGGALHSLFPSVTEQEKAEAELLMAEVITIGDPLRPLPDSAEKIELSICRSHKERGTKILAFIRKRYPTHLITQVTARLTIHSVGNKNDKFCKDWESRRVYTTNASVINTRISELSLARNKLIDANMVISYGNTTLKSLAILCCAFWNFKADILNAVRERLPNNFLNDYYDAISGKPLQYLCVYHSEGSKACKNLVIPPPPTNVARFASICSAALASISRLTSIAP